MTPSSNIALNHRHGNHIVHEYALNNRPEHIFVEIEGEWCVFIPLTKGKWTVVSCASYHIVKDHAWCFHGAYAVRRGDDGNLLRMHRAIAQAPCDLHIDHINGIRLDNRDRNLRLASNQQNSFNTGLGQRNKTGIKGVCWIEAKQHYLVQIKAGGVKKSLRLKDFDEAVRIRRQWELEHHGDFRRRT